MAQPRYTAGQLLNMTHRELADELDRWADVRVDLNDKRIRHEKERLEVSLLREAATRLRQFQDMEAV